MPKKEYGWDQGNVPIIGEHSLAKHRILREYVERYIEILTRNPRIERLKVALVDGFAGGGIYEIPGQNEPHFGSPVILMQATAEAQNRVNESLQKPVSISATYYFVEKNPVNVAALESTLQEHVYRRHRGAIPLIFTGAFEDQLDPIIAHIKQKGRAHRTIFVLDQYGYTAVPLASLQLIFRELHNAEVFLTLAVGWIASYLRDAASAREVVQNSLGIRAEATEEEIEEHLLGDGTQAKLRVVQQLLHGAFVKRSGARFATPFFIMSRESHRPYWFLHLANSSKANDVVKELHWEIQNHFSHYGDAGLAMLGFDPYREPDPAQLSFAFDSIAQQRTERVLLEQLPERIGTRYPRGVGFGELFSELTNETPATKAMLGKALKVLCQEGELSKEGGQRPTASNRDPFPGRRRRDVGTANADEVVKTPRWGTSGSSGTRGAEIAPDGGGGERESFGEVVLRGRLEPAARLNPGVPGDVQAGAPGRRRGVRERPPARGLRAQERGGRARGAPALKVASGGVIFTAIQKSLPDGPGERYPRLSERRNIVVIADEAHRSQYGLRGKLVVNDREGKYGSSENPELLKIADSQARTKGRNGKPPSTPPGAHTNSFAVRFLCPESARLPNDNLEAVEQLTVKWGLHYAAARLHLQNTRGAQLPHAVPPELKATGTEGLWETYERPEGIEGFPLRETPPERRTEVARLAAHAWSRGAIQRDEFAALLGVTPAEEVERVADYFGIDSPALGETAA